jgi:nucleoside-diphosphate-sugar epimerase
MPADKLGSMRIVVLGGTRFIGRALVAELVGTGHEVAIVHRGRHEPEDDGSALHFHLDRRRLSEHRDGLLGFGPDAVIDLSAMTAEDAEGALALFDDSVRKVVASSGDVYRACLSVAEGTVTDRVPLSEDAPLRDRPTPDRDVVLPGWDYDTSSYEKLDVERLYLKRGGIVCRLPMVYGEHDYKRREDFVLRRVRAGRTRIPVGSGTFLWSRGYAPEIVRGLRLAVERADPGEVFNLAEQECVPIRGWIEEILAAADHDAELVRVPDHEVPDDLFPTTAISQDWQLDATKAADLLGWTHAPWRKCVHRSVRWHLANPPEDADADFSEDDQAFRE